MFLTLFDWYLQEDGVVLTIEFNVTILNECFAVGAPILKGAEVFH